MKRIPIPFLATALLAMATAVAQEVPLPTGGPPPVAVPVLGEEFDVYQNIGTYRVASRLKVTDDKVTRVEIKPVILRVTSNGTNVRVATAGRDSGASRFEIYRSDGIGRQHNRSGVLEVIPGVQASSCNGGVLRHIRVTRESLTITQFGGVSNQTVITHATAVEPASPKVVATPADR